MLIVNCKSMSVSVNDNDMAYRYFSDIRRYKLLTEEDEQKLLYTIKNGTKDESLSARCKLIESNQRIIASVAKHLSNGNNFNDLVSEGTIGLNKAIDKYDIRFKQHFMTYAIFWIHKYIVSYIIGNDKFITPKNATKVHSYVAKAKNKFFLENGRNVTPEELQEILCSEGIRFSNKEDLVNPTIISVETIDTDDNGSEDSEVTHIEYARIYNEATAKNEIEDKINSDHLKSIVEKYLSFLTDKQRYIVTHYHGIDCIPESFQIIANTFDTEARNIVREYNKAIAKIQKKIGLQNISEK